MKRRIRDEGSISHLLSICLVGGLSAAAVVGCTGEDRDGTPQSGWLVPNTEHSAQPLTFEEFRKQARVFSNGQPDGYIVESHIKIYSEESLHTYFHAVYEQPVHKSVGWTIGGALGARPVPTNIRYCLSNGWGAPIGTFTAPAKATVVAQIAAAAAHWQGVTKVVFVYAGSLDGVGCTTANIANGTLAVDFVVRPTAVSCTASGAFPWFARSDQAFDIPACGLPGLLGDHELGHILGLRHEMEHSQNNCGVTPSSSDTDLTTFDTESVMFYADCVGNAASRPISPLDGVGIRKIYGPPDWWWNGLL